MLKCWPCMTCQRKQAQQYTLFDKYIIIQVGHGRRQKHERYTIHGSAHITSARKSALGLIFPQLECNAGNRNRSHVPAKSFCSFSPSGVVSSTLYLPV